MSLRARLILLLLLATLPLIAVEIHSEIGIRAERQQEVSETATRLLEVVDAEQDRIDEGTHQLLVAFSENPAIRNGDWAECDRAASQINATVAGYINLGVADLNGNILCAHLSTSSTHFGLTRAQYAAIDQHKDFAVGTFIVGSVSRLRGLPLSIPWRDQAGDPRGVIWATLDLQWLAQHFAERFNSPDMTLLMTDRKGTIIMRQPDNDAWAGKSIGEQYMSFVNAGANGRAEMIGVDGTKRIIAYSPVFDKVAGGVYVGVGLSTGPYLALINAATQRKIELMIGALLLTLTAAWIGTSAFIRAPVAKLLTATRLWQGGDTTARAALGDRSSELGKLGAAFDEMAAALDRRQRAQRAAEESLARLNADLEQRVMQEVEARDRAQKELHQAQKIEAVGRLTAGVAHDFNNLLTAIVGNLQLLQNRFARDPDVLRRINAAQRAADRGAKLTQQLLAFSRKQRLASEPIDIDRIVESMRGLLQSTIGATIRIETVLGSDRWLALGDASQVELMVLNLVINSRDAMVLGGAITIETANVILGAPHRPEEPPAGDYVMLSIADTGVGIPPDILERVFEPFFTTKEVGKGSGLGLPQVLGVAQQLGGGMSISTKLGEGTCVKVYLPRTAQLAVANPSVVVDDVSDIPEVVPATILLVDDDSDVRAVSVNMLRSAGHAVIEASSGGAALERLDHEGSRIDLMVIDFAMPGMNGIEVARLVRRNWPRLGILFVTGFADTAVLAADAAGDEILQKPFKLDALTAAVARLLERTRRQHGNAIDYPNVASRTSH
jgi:signal transduction histidine kinase/ActR/RegA family two-component response regulator